MSMNHFLLRVSETRLKEYQRSFSVRNINLLESDLEKADEVFTEGEFTSIKKSWEGMVYLITGKPFEEALTEPFTSIITGKHALEVPLEKAIVAPRFLSAGEVHQAWQMLSLITDDIFISRYDAGLMNQLSIYPGNWEVPEARSYLIRGFNHVKDFYARASAHDQSVIVFLS